MQESTAKLLPAAEQMLQELEEEARVSWEDRAVFYATQITNLAGEAFETLNENRWYRRDCKKYQDELDWVIKNFRRICKTVTYQMTAEAARLEMDDSKSQRLTIEEVDGPSAPKMQLNNLDRLVNWCNKFLSRRDNRSHRQERAGREGQLDNGRHERARRTTKGVFGNLPPSYSPINNTQW